jgi:hypothetical protein
MYWDAMSFTKSLGTVQLLPKPLPAIVSLPDGARSASFDRILRKSTGAFAHGHHVVGENLVQDLIFIAATALIFAIAILYVHGCERLK